MSIEKRKAGLRVMIEGNKTVHYGLAPIVVELATDLYVIRNQYTAAMQMLESYKEKCNGFIYHVYYLHVSGNNTTGSSWKDTIGYYYTEKCARKALEEYKEKYPKSSHHGLQISKIEVDNGK